MHTKKSEPSAHCIPKMHIKLTAHTEMEFREKQHLLWPGTIEGWHDTSGLFILSGVACVFFLSSYKRQPENIGSDCQCITVNLCFQALVFEPGTMLINTHDLILPKKLFPRSLYALAIFPNCSQLFRYAFWKGVRLDHYVLVLLCVHSKIDACCSRQPGPILLTVVIIKKHKVQMSVIFRGWCSRLTAGDGQHSLTQAISLYLCFSPRLYLGSLYLA